MPRVRWLPVLHALVCGAALALPAVHAQSWPNRPVRIVVPFPPGGGLDFFARAVSPRLQEALGQTLIIENRSGAGGMVGAESVARAAPDGHTVLFASSAEITINQHLYPKIAYDASRDFAPVSYAAHAAMMLSVHPSVPVKSLQELIALARARPGQLAYASPGSGGIQHLTGELFKALAKIDIVHVPYKGAGPAVIDMVGGHVAMGVTALPSSIQQARAGRLRPLAVTTRKRSAVAPELATFAEQGFPDLDLVVWYGVLLPAGTPADIVGRLSTEINRTVQSADVSAKLLQQGVESVGTTPEQFAKFIQSEIVRYGGIIKASGAKPD
ncbi:MAG: tripartite tricarboxylate transporter substrate binding protein [Proteobacteria bacterium]|nr:tripartite tricarboxylate transporter substrate binding protein [Burkholderiales bacterium]